MKKEILQIKERNSRVEADKAWETSKTRRFIIAIITYIVALILLKILKAPSPFLSALIPAVGFLLSTLTLNYFKNLWLNKLYK